MLDSIRMKNLRSFEDTGDIVLLPLTLVVGKNSSGKSTIIRSFPLLRQSVETRTTGPIAWFGRFVDFGAFPDAVRREQDEITFDFGFRRDARTIRRGRWFSVGTSPSPGFQFMEDEVRISVALHLQKTGERDPTTIARSCEVRFYGHSVSFSLTGKNNVVVLVNGEPLETSQTLAAIQGRGLFPLVIPVDAESRHPRRRGMAFQQDLLNAFDPLFWHKANLGTRLKVIYRRTIGPIDAMLDDLQSEGGGGTVFRRKTAELTEQSKVFRRIATLLLAHAAMDLLDACGDDIVETARAVNYIAPVRATAQRYYRVSDLAVDEVDFEGGNTALFIKSMSPAQKTNFREWTKQALGFEVFARSDGGHVLLKVKMEGTDEEFNLADMGFGISQILPIVAQVWSAVFGEGPRRHRGRHRVVALEQPELHLHPALQRRLARLLAHTAAKSRGVRFIIETHSQAMVNEIGRMIEEDLLHHEQVQIMIVDPDAERSISRVSKAEFESDGTLSNWPHGFFDWQR